MGDDPALGQGQVDRGQAGQCAGGDDRRKAELPAAVSAATLPVAGGWLLRVGIAAKRQATGLLLNARRRPVLPRRTAGDLDAAGANRQARELPGLGQAQAETLCTFTVITTTPNRLAKRVHDRMPVIVHPADYGNWLSPESKAADLKRLLRPFDDEPIQEHYVTPLMNTPRFEAPECIEPIIN